MARKSQNSITYHPLVATDLGSHSIRSMAAEQTEDGLLHILGADVSKRKVCVERGVVTNTSDASYCIGECMKLLANRINMPLLMNCFTALGGRSMTIVEVSSNRTVNHSPVTQELLEEMDLECKQKIEARNPQAAVLAVVPYSYLLDGVEQNYPPESSQRVTDFIAKYVAFVGIKELEKKVEDSFIRTPKHLEQMFARPDALLCALATEEDIKRGCAIIDMGAQTTTMTIFKNDRYVYNKVVSLGGLDITRDIQLLGVSFEYAERLKCEFGNAAWEIGMPDPCYRVPDTEGGTVMLRTSDIHEAIFTRLNQIFATFREDLQQYEQQIGVVYITGGASMLQGVDQYVQRLTSLPVMYGSHAPWLTADTPDEYCAPNYSSLVGTLLLGAQYRAIHPKVEPQGELKKLWKNLTDNAKNSMMEIFTEQY